MRPPFLEIVFEGLMVTLAIVAILAPAVTLVVLVECLVAGLIP